MTDARHLDDAEILALAAGGPSASSAAPEAVAHVAACPLCRAEVEAFSAALKTGAGEPSPFVTARAERSLLRAIDGEVAARRRAWHPAAVVAAMIVSSAAGALGAVAVGGSLRSHHEPVVSAERSPPVTATLRPRVSERVAEIASAPIAPAPAPALLSPAVRPLPRVGDAPRAALRAPVRMRDNAPTRALDSVEPARALVLALEAGDDVEAELLALFDRDPSALASIDADLLRVGSAFALRTRCERGLLTQRNRATVDACRTFAQRFPADPAVRTLAFAAGRVAEDDLSDPATAEEEYERALVLSPFVGAGMPDALWARARVRAAQGKVDEARADLLLYLSQVPTARTDDAVLELAHTLGLTR